MTRTMTFLAVMTAVTSAHADPGHLAAAGGHAHWELLAGLVIIAAIALPLLAKAVWRRR